MRLNERIHTDDHATGHGGATAEQAKEIIERLERIEAAMNQRS